MEDFKRCSRCIMPECFPGIYYNESNVCNHCLEWDRRWKDKEDWKDDTALTNVLGSIRSDKKYYDCVIGLSGGKDSCYVACVLAEKGLHALAVTFDNGFLSEEALRNIKNAVERLSLSHIMVKPSKDRLKEMYRHCFLLTGDFCTVCNLGIRATMYRTALSHDIKWIVAGYSPRSEAYSPEEFAAGSSAYFKNVAQSLFSKEEIGEYLYVSDMQRAWWHVSKKVRFLQLPRYTPWDEDHILGVIKDKLNWQGNLWEQHRDCHMADVKMYLKWKKFGVSEQTSKFSALIRDGQLERQAALEKTQEYEQKLSDQELSHREQIKSHLDISEEELVRSLQTDHTKYLAKSDSLFSTLKKVFYR